MSYLRLNLASHRIALLAGVAFTAALLGLLAPTPALAGCASGDVPSSVW